MLRHPRLLGDPLGARQRGRHRVRSMGNSSTYGHPGQARRGCGPNLVARYRPRFAAGNQSRIDVSSYADPHAGNLDQTASSDRQRDGAWASSTEQRTTHLLHASRGLQPTPIQSRLKLLLSPDGKAVRIIVTHDGDPATTEDLDTSTDRECRARGLDGQGRWPTATLNLGGTAAIVQGNPGRGQVRPDDRGTRRAEHSSW